MRAVSYADITPLDVEWRWENFLPESELVVISGKRGTGKGMLWADIVARMTRGDPMPGETERREPANVLLATNEDDPNTAMTWRLRAAGADLTRVYDVTEGFRVPSQLESLREAIREVGNVGLVHIDPLADVSDISLRSSEKRIREELMNPLRFGLAKEMGVIVSIVLHRTKQGRTVGAGAIEDAARVVLHIDRLTADPKIRVLRVEKSNNGSDEASIAYTLTGAGKSLRVTYLDTPEAPTREPSTLERIVDALKSGPLELHTLVQRLGLPDGTVRTALTRGKSAGEVYSPRRSVWAVPSAEAPTEAPTLTVIK